MSPLRIRRRSAVIQAPLIPLAVCASIALAALTGCASPPPPSVPAAAVQMQPQPQVQVVPPAPPQQTVEAPAPEPAPASAPLPPKPAAPAKVALLVPLSGRGAEVGQALLNAAQLAVFDFPDANVTLLPKDTHDTPQAAANAAREAIAEGAELILGPLFSSQAKAVAPVAAGPGIQEIAFSTDRQVAGGNVFLVGFLPEDDVGRVVGYAAKNGATHIAGLFPATAYGQRVADVFRSALAASGASAGPVQTYDPSSPQAMANALRALTGRTSAPNPASPPDQAAGAAQSDAPSGSAGAALPFDALMLAEGGQPLHALAPLLPFYGLDAGKVRLLGTGLWDDPDVRSEAALTGAWFAAPPPENFERFAARYQDTFGAEPPRVASLGYDAAALAAVLARAAPPGQRFTAAALTDPRGFAGVDGIFRLLPSGLPERGLAVLEIHPDSFGIVDPAPIAFPGAQANASGADSGEQFGQNSVQNQPTVGRGAQAVTLAQH